MMMLVLFLTAVLAIVTSYPTNDQQPDYSGCKTYNNNDEINWNDGKDRLCTSRYGTFYCKEWECPTPSCDNPLTSERGVCRSYCNGTCTYGGTVHKIGKEFISPDGSNKCWCGESNTYFCMYSGFTVESLCRKPSDS